MQRELLVLRHGKSDWTEGVPDFERPLAKRGRKAVKRMGRWMLEEGLAPDHIVSSPAERARQTVLRLCRFAKLPESLIEWEPAIYEAAAPTLLEVLGRCPHDRRRVMLVGHNPGFEDLVRHLAGPSVEDWEGENLMPTAALAQLSMPEDWTRLEAGSARVLRITRPRDIEDG